MGSVRLTPFRNSNSKPKQTTPRDRGCQPKAALPIICSAALLKLAAWSQQRHALDQGGKPCDVIPDDRSPPIFHPSETEPRAPESVAGTASRQSTEGSAASD